MRKELQAEPESMMTSYLLGELSEAEMFALEARYFEEPEVFDQVLAAETKLVDDYARNRLSPEIRERFERSYMAHPERRERSRLGMVLTSRLDGIEQREASPSWQSLLAWFSGPGLALRLSMAVGVLLIAVGGVWVFTGSQRKPSDELALTPDSNSQRVPIETDSGKNEPLQQSPDSLEPDPQPSRPASSPKPSVSPNAHTGPRSVSLALTMGGVRGGDSSQVPLLVIPRGAAEARLLLSLKENAYSSYRLSLKDLSGTEIASRSIIKPKGASLVLTVPANKLSDGDYVLTLTGVEADGAVDDLSKSLFRVKKRN